MRSVFKILVIVLAFSLGLACVWAIRNYSYVTSLIGDASPALVATPNIDESPLPLDASKAERTLFSDQEPRFEDYPVGKIYEGQTARLRNRKDILEYKEPLQLAIDTQAVDFAGHYIATNWSCGMWCSMNAFIDAETGQVYWSPVRTEVCLPHQPNEFNCDENFSNVDYRIDSNLIVFFGFRAVSDEDEEKGFHYYRFEKGKFHHLKSKRVKDQRSTRQVQIDEFDENRDR